MYLCCAADMKKARRKSPRLSKNLSACPETGQAPNLVRPPSGTGGVPMVQAARRLTAFGPLPMRSGSTSKVTFWPSTSVRRPDASIAEIWTNTSLAPPSRRDEAEAFGRVEEFNGAGLGHWGNSFTRSVFGGPARHLASRAVPGGCFGSHALAHGQTPRRKRGRQRFHSIGERSSKTFRSPGRKCPNTEFIARKRERCKIAPRAATLGASDAKIDRSERRPAANRLGCGSGHRPTDGVTHGPGLPVARTDARHGCTDVSRAKSRERGCI